MRFYLKDFCIFISVAETGSLSKTADIMGLSISSVSKRLSRLEDYLQTNLFEKNTRRVKLSTIGKKAYIRSKEMTKTFSEFIDDIRGCDITRLNIFFNASGFQLPFVDWIYDYSSKDNKPSLHIHTDLSRKKEEGIELDDIFISKERAVWPSAIHRKLSPIQRGIFSNVSTNKNINMDDAKKEKIVFFNNGADEIATVKNSLSGEVIEIKADIQTDDINIALKLIRERGVIIFGLPAYVIPEFSLEESLHEIMTDWIIEPVQYYLIWKERQFYKKDFTSFLNYIEENFNDHILV